MIIGFKTKGMRELVLAGLSFTALLSVSGGAMAEGAVPFQNFSGGLGANHIEVPGDSLTATGSSTKNSYSDNYLLLYSAWAHNGRWWNFHLDALVDATIRVDAVTSGFMPGMTVYASGNVAFDGGTDDPGEVSSAGFSTPHSFNATGAVGDFGTGWMTGTNGNMIETLGYAVAGPDHHDYETGWGEEIHHGAHDVSVSNTFENGVSGSVGDGFVELFFNDLQPGWYTIFVGGTSSSSPSINNNFALNITTTEAVAPVPLPPAVYLLGTALVGLVGVARRKAAG